MNMLYSFIVIAIILYVAPLIIIFWASMVTGIFVELFPNLAISQKIKKFWDDCDDDHWLYKILDKLYHFLH